jgi:fructose-bisphosphate aldolase class II
MLVKPGVLFNHCYGKYGIAAINIWSMEQVIALFRGADKTGTPFIVQTTPAARNYAGHEMLLSMIHAASSMYPETRYAIHLDHGNEEHILAALKKGGYTSVMIDASHDPFKKNITRTKKMVDYAHEQGAEVEAELGILSGVEDDLMSSKSKYTQPEMVEEFVGETGCDSLAIAVGTSHGAYKFSGGEGLQFDILSKIQERLPGFPLVLHGGSAVNREEILRINEAGGLLKAAAKGVDADELQKSIRYGICKINIATDVRLIWTRVHREFFKASPDQIDPVLPGRTYMDELEKFIIEKFKLLGALNQAVI